MFVDNGRVRDTNVPYGLYVERSYGVERRSMKDVAKKDVQKSKEGRGEREERTLRWCFVSLVHAL